MRREGTDKTAATRGRPGTLGGRGDVVFGHHSTDRTAAAPLDVRLQGVNLGGWLVAGATPSTSPASPDRRTSPASPAGASPTPGSRWTTPCWTGRRAGWPSTGPCMACLGAGLRCVLALRLAPGAGPALFASAEDWGRLVTRWETIARRYAGRPRGPLLRPPRPAGRPGRPAPRGARPPSARCASRQPPRPPPAAPGATGGRAWNALALRLTQAVRARDERHTHRGRSPTRPAPAAFTHLRPTRDPIPSTASTASIPAPLPGRERRRRGAGRTTGGNGRAASGPTPPSPTPGRWTASVGTGPACRPSSSPRWSSAASTRRPVYLGAFGVASGAPRAGQLTWLRTVLSLCRAHGIGWASWTYRGGPFALVGPQGTGLRRAGHPAERGLSHLPSPEMARDLRTGTGGFRSPPVDPHLSLAITAFDEALRLPPSLEHVLPWLEPSPSPTKW